LNAESTDCEAKVCICDNGHALTDGACIDENFLRCAACNNDFVMATTWVNTHQVDICEPLPICFCNDGVEATGSDCHTDATEICLSCNEEFALNESTNICEAIVCNCSDGVAATGAACTSQGATICVVCNEGFKMVNDACVEDTAAVCTCSNGEVATDTCSVSGEHCLSCDVGFTLDTQACNSAPVTYVKLPGTNIKSASRIELENGLCLGLVDATVDGGQGEVRSYDCDHANVFTEMYFVGKDKALYGKKNSLFNKGRVCLQKSVDSNNFSRLHTVSCKDSNLPIDTNINKKKGLKRLQMTTSQYYLTKGTEGPDAKNYFEFPHWDT